MPDVGDLVPATAPPVTNGDASHDLLALPEGTKVSPQPAVAMMLRAPDVRGGTL